MSYIKYLSLLTICFVAFNMLTAQVPVIQEPHHKPVLVNNYVRLLDVHINPNDTTQYHIHAAPSVIVFLSNSTIGMQKFGEAPSASNNVMAGTTSFVDYGTNPITHRVFNAGNNVFHVMDIELVRKELSADSCSALQQAGIQTTLNEKMVSAYKLDVNANQSLSIDKSSCANLLICVNGGIVSSNKTIKAGEYIFFNPNDDISLTNKQNNNAECVLLELK